MDNQRNTRIKGCTAAVILGSALLLLDGCARDRFQPKLGDEYEKADTFYSNRTHQPDGNPNQKKLYGLHYSGGDNHANKTLAYKQDTSYRLSLVPGVLTAVVMTTDRNAYVGLILDNSGTGTAGRGNKLEGSNVGGDRGMYNANDGTQYMDPNKMASDENSYFSIKDPEELSEKFKQHIASEVRKELPDILEVHVSASRDFVNHLNVYAQVARENGALGKYISDFNRLVTNEFGVKP